MLKLTMCMLPILMTQEVIWIALLRHAGKNTACLNKAIQITSCVINIGNSSTIFWRYPFNNMARKHTSVHQ